MFPAVSALLFSRIKLTDPSPFRIRSLLAWNAVHHVVPVTVSNTRTVIVAVPTTLASALEVAVTVILSPVFAFAGTVRTPSADTSIAVPLAFVADHFTS